MSPDRGRSDGDDAPLTFLGWFVTVLVVVIVAIILSLLFWLIWLLLSLGAMDGDDRGCVTMFTWQLRPDGARRTSISYPCVESL